jgi:peptidoglycan/LPS O-acetylase OafA/YrhL
MLSQSLTGGNGRRSLPWHTDGPGSMTTFEIKVPKIGGGRVDAIDELKGAAILLIILYHAGGVLVWQNLLHGDVGVDLFVILSGVGLALGSRVQSAGAFLRRRLLRIFPAYWIVLTLCLLANMHFLQLRYTSFDIIIHYLGIHAWFGDHFGFGINDSFWFVTLIVSLYLIYAPLRTVLVRPDRVVFWGGIISVVVAYAYFLTGQSGCFGHIGLRLPGFFFGLLIGALLRDGHLEIPLSAALAAGLVLLIYVPYTRGVIFYSEITAFALAMGYVFWWRVKAPAGLVDPTARCLRFFGKYSLEIFLIHQPLIRDYNYYIHGRFFNEPRPSVPSLIVGMLIGLGVTVVLSVEIHRLLNRLALQAPGAKKAQ